MDPNAQEPVPQVVTTTSNMDIPIPNLMINGVLTEVSGEVKDHD